MKYSFVIPCYRSSATIEKVVTMTMEEMRNEEIEFVLVNDGSPDEGKTSAKIKQLAEKFSNVTAVDLAKNAGQQNAVMCGLNVAAGEYIICMDDDMQTHPSQIHKLIEKMSEGYDVVYAYYPEKEHAWFRNLGSKFSSWTVRKLIGKPKWLKTSSFWIAKRFVRDYVIQYKNAYVFMPGLFLRTTSNIGNIEVTHFAREEGTSGYNLKALIKLWSNILGFSIRPLRLASILGGVFSVIGFLGALLVIIRKIFFGIEITGWASLIVVNCFFSGIILIFLGLIGEYLGRMFLSSGNQPQYVIREIKRNEENEK